MSALRQDLTSELARAGLNLVGVADPARYDEQVGPERKAEALLPGTRSILVAGSGGAALWHALLADLRSDPTGLTAQAHPLDAYVRRAVSRLDPGLEGHDRRWFFAAGDETVHIDFRLLSLVAGLGVDSRLRLLMSPVFGPWLGLRAACFTTADLGADGPLDLDLCDGCEAPCVETCPGGSLAGGSWDVKTCSDFHHTSTLCDTSCHARLACPRGAEHRYPPDEILYHYNRRLGRERLRQLVGVDSDGFEGSGPYWGTWKERVDVTGTKDG